MTTKQISEAVGKDERTVRRWVESMADKMSSIADKLSASNSTYPADYTLAEVCQIIEQGMGAAAADVYRTNAANAEMKKAPTQYSAAYIREVRLTLGKEAAAALINGGQPQQPKPLQIISNNDRLPEHIARQVYAVAAKAWEKEQAKREARGMQSLFD
jgi:hypothetical protein